MNSYFASVEQQANPFLRGKPLGVCAYLHEHGCVIAASIEAKWLGMKVGMTVKEAREKVPHAVFVENDPPKYRAVTSRVFAILHELTDRVEQYSIDEAFLDLTGWYRDPAEAAWALVNVRRRIKDDVGEWLRCSIGIAPTKFLAKTASDMEKPNGLVVITHENLDEMLAKLDLEDVCGIGHRMRRRMERLGIHSLLELKQHPMGNLAEAFGINGLFWWYKLRGIQCEKFVEAHESLPKTIGHSYCVPERVSREGKAVAVLVKLTERAGRRLRQSGLRAGSVSISIGFRMPGFTSPQGPFWQPVHGQGGSMHVRLAEPAADSFTLVQAACDAMRQLWHGESVNFIAVTLQDLSAPTGQLRLDHTSDSWRTGDDRRQRVSEAMDCIRDRYGDRAVQLASMMKLEDEAPDRIGFRKTEGVDISPYLRL